MILTEQEIKEAVGFTTDQMTAYRRIESAMLEKLRAQEPVAYMTYKGYLLHAADPKVAVHFIKPAPLFLHPDPRITELEEENKRLKAIIRAQEEHQTRHGGYDPNEI